MNSKQLTRIGIFYLEEAILEVLLEQKGTYVKQVNITKSIGVYDRWKDSGWLVAGILNKLEAEGRIHAQRGEKGRAQGWQITDTEYNNRIDTEI
jgi:hypothetical protein